MSFFVVSNNGRSNCRDLAALSQTCRDMHNKEVRAYLAAASTQPCCPAYRSFIMPVHQHWRLFCGCPTHANCDVLGLVQCPCCGRNRILSHRAFVALTCLLRVPLPVVNYGTVWDLPPTAREMTLQYIERRVTEGQFIAACRGRVMQNIVREEIRDLLREARRNL